MKKIYFFTEEVSFELSAPDATAVWLQTVIQQECHVLTHLNFIFCSDRYLQACNIQYLQKNTLTDVLAFDYAHTPRTIEGDIYISIDRVQENAKNWKQPFMKELHTVMVHGVLHLLGYQDHTPKDKAEMREKEAKYVAQNRYLANVINASPTKATHQQKI